MEKKLQVFISSTYNDLLEERQAAVEAILDAGDIPAGMELFKSGKKQMETIKKWIDESDVYMLILGGRYGSIEQESGKSYTQLEYDYALSKEMPVFAIVINEDALKDKIRKWVENGGNVGDIHEDRNRDKYEEFREIVLGKIISFYADTKDIKLEVYRQISEIKKQDNLDGWIRGKESSEEIKQLKEENKKLLEIIYRRDDDTKNLIVRKEESFNISIESEVISDLNKYYNNLQTNGLESYLQNKYIKGINQEYSDELFKSLWKITFIVDSKQNDKNREANYWILYYIYRQNREHYKYLMKEDEDYYFNNLSVEAFKLQKLVSLELQINNYSNSRIITLINFIEENSEIYDIFNDYAKNIIYNIINHTFIEANIESKKLYEIGSNVKNDILFKQQLVLKAGAVFITEDIENHFESIKMMISNYCSTAERWCSTGNYSALGEDTISKIYKQAKYRGKEREFIKFLISYCMSAHTFYQAEYMIEYMKPYMKDFTEEDFYFALTKMSENSQYTDNRSRVELRKILEDNYQKAFNKEILKTDEEKYLYPELYNVDLRKFKGNYDDMLNLIENKAKDCRVWNLWNNILEPLINGMKEKGIVFNGNIDRYVNISKTLKSDENFNWGFKRLQEVFVTN